MCSLNLCCTRILFGGEEENMFVLHFWDQITFLTKAGKDESLLHFRLLTFGIRSLEAEKNYVHVQKRSCLRETTKTLNV